MNLFRRPGLTFSLSPFLPLSLTFCLSFLPFSLSPFLPLQKAHALTFDTIQIASVDTHGAQIRWVTDAPSNGNIYYGLRVGEATRTMLVIDQAKDHLTGLYGLEEGENYVFRITARDTAGKRETSDWHTFRTLGDAAPRIVKVDQVHPRMDGGKFVWRANVPVQGTFECGYDTTYGFQTEEKTYNIAHEVLVQRFRPRRRIQYRITARDRRGREAPEWIGTFTTAEDNIAAKAKTTGTFTRNPEPNFIPDTPPIIDRITDGALNYFHSMATSGDPDKDTQWVEIDLGKIQIVGQVLTYWRQLAYPLKFAVKGSLDGERWVDLGDTHNAATGAVVRSYTGDPVLEHVVPVGGMVLRYVRVEVPKGAPYHKRFDNYRFVQLFELKVFPPEMP
ncbi:discoidin domain-containing protein [bacterium]|nr:discoidin domain-containing protein [bacterium]